VHGIPALYIFYKSGVSLHDIPTFVFFIKAVGEATLKGIATVIFFIKVEGDITSPTCY
jgi:hypothetical protein